MSEIGDKDLARINRNVQRLFDGGASEAEMDEYVALEGVSPKRIRDFNVQQALDQRETEMRDRIEVLKAKGPQGNVNLHRFLTDQPRIVDRVLGRRGLRAAGGTAGTTFGFAKTFGKPFAVSSRAAGLAGVAAAVTLDAIFDIAAEVEDAIAFESERKLTFGGAESLRKAFLSKGEAAAEEAVAQGLGVGVTRFAGPAFRTVGRGLGLAKESSRRILGEARIERLTPTAFETGTAPVQAVLRPLGVMPGIAKPAREAMEKRLVQISDRLTGILDDVSIVHSIPTLGRNIAETSSARFGAKRSAVSRLYVDMYAAFDRIGNPAVVPTAIMKQRARELLGAIDQLPKEVRRAVEGTGVLDVAGKEITKEVAKKGRPVGAFGISDKSLRSELNRFTKLPEFISPREARAMNKALNKAARLRSGKMGAEVEFGVIIQMNRALKNSLAAIDPRMLPDVLGPSGPGQFALGASRTQAANIVGKIKNANRAHGELMRSASTPAAKRVARGQAEVFRPGTFERPGAIDIDQLADDLIQAESTLRSPDFINTLGALIGPENQKQLARLVLTKAAKVVGVEDVGGRAAIVTLDAAGMETRLGLGPAVEVLGQGAVRANREALRALLKGSGVTIGTIESFLRVAKRNQTLIATNPSVFLTRRLMLTGRFKLPGMARPSAQETGGVAGLVGKIVDVGGVIIGGRLAVKLLTTEKGLRLLTEGMGKAGTAQGVSRFLARLRTAYPEDDINLAQIPDQEERIRKGEDALGMLEGEQDERRLPPGMLEIERERVARERGIL